MGRKYPKVQAGEWVSPVRKGYRMACCDCGLVHKMDFALIAWRNGGKKIIFRAYRDERATAAIRRRDKS
jgi:hypothetical protein